ncbi:43394_t:CDS:1 [Gigaspora margarita]|uniref:43394_t:CDS:1 n=1 Tax=Gigaspora margarita TaxID=4874 RepID=A0ABN7VP98_GIGMA|nr:43394_t:CDS:1 [Gigaspora margarita]
MKGVMKVSRKAITKLTVNRKRRIYEKVKDIVRAFKLKRKEKYKILRKSFITKSQKKSWKFIKQFKNILETYKEKYEEMQKRDKYKYRIVEKIIKERKKRSLWL